ncbi:MAG: hypothetical protein ACREME_10315 [Gemmatimonadales bacterium]
MSSCWAWSALFGVVRLSSFGPLETRQAAVPLSAVARIAVQEVNRRATTLAFVGVPVAVVLGILLIGGIDD